MSRAVAPALAATVPGTNITLTATATFTDSVGTALSAASNTLTTTVQNAPSLTVTAPSNKNITPGMIVVDTFTLADTGNNTGTFALSGDATFGGTGSETLKGYVLNGASSGTCSVAAPCTYGTLNGQGGMAGIAINGTATVGVEYQETGTTIGQTVQTTLSANIAYAAGTGTIAQTSSNATATPTDTIVNDARLDIQVTSTPPPGPMASNRITWTVTVNNGGGYAAHDVLANEGGNPSGLPGVVIYMQVPVYNGAALALASQPTTPTVSGDSVLVEYSSTAVGSFPSSYANFSTTYSAGATWMVVYLYGAAGGNELPSAPGGSTGAGAVITPQITFTFSTVQPLSSKSAAVSLMVNGLWGGQPWATGSYPVIGPGIAVGTPDAAGSTYSMAVESNTTPGSGATWPGGASNNVTNQAYAASSYRIAANEGAVGSFSADNAAYYNSGTNGASFAGAVTLTNVCVPAPQSVYQNERWASPTLTYSLVLSPSTRYLVRLHFAEGYVTGAGQRVFQVSINGTQVLSNFDIYATAGGQNIAVVKEFYGTTDVNGLLAISFYGATANNPKINGIEVLPSVTPAATSSLAVSPSTGVIPGTVLTYTDTFTNTSSDDAPVFVVTQPVPATTDFQVGSASASVPAPLGTATVTYSNNGGSTYAYTPVSAGGGASSGYDRSVTNVRWTFSGVLCSASTNNSGSVSYAVRVQ